MQVQSHSIGKSQQPYEYTVCGIASISSFFTNGQLSHSTKRKPWSCGYHNCSFDTGHRGSLTRHRQSKSHHIQRNVGDRPDPLITSPEFPTTVEGVDTQMPCRRSESPYAGYDLSVPEKSTLAEIPSPQPVLTPLSFSLDDGNGSPEPTRNMFSTERIRTIPDAVGYNEANSVGTIGLHLGDLETPTMDLSSGGSPPNEVAPLDEDEQSTDWTGMPSCFDEIESVFDGLEEFKTHDDDSVVKQLRLEHEPTTDPMSEFDDFIRSCSV